MTIERTTVSGRKATVAYIRDDFTPTTPEKATLAKVLFDDGDIVFLSMARDAPLTARDAHITE